MKKVLVVEDDQLWATLITSYIAQTGATSRVVTSGEEAIEVIDMYHPALVIVDMLLAGQTGMALLQELRSHDDLAALPVIVCSSVPIEAEHLAGYGVAAILDKSSMTPASFRAAIEGFLR